MSEAIIKVENVSKTFRLPHEKHTSVKSVFVNLLRPHKKGFELQKALDNVSFTIEPGEFFGIVGRNGSGKSTLLKLLAGIYVPSEGHISINGSLTPFIELGVGFNPELTGRENVFLNGALLGFSRKEMSAMYNDIVKFAELERFMDQKLKNYSSGMQVRLAFSIAIRAKSDILLIDEVLAVGDAAFQAKCYDYFQTLKQNDTTVVFVSHDRASLERFCERGVLINNGQVIDYGNIRAVLKSYSTIVLGELDRHGQTPTPRKRKNESVGHVSIYDTHTTNSKGLRTETFSYEDDITVEYGIKFNQQVKNPIIGITIWKKNLKDAIYATNTLISSKKESGIFKKGETVKLRTKLPKGLNDGEYYVEPAVANESVTVFFDQIPKACRFIINGSNNPYSVMSSSNKVEIVKN